MTAVFRPKCLPRRLRGFDRRTMFREVLRKSRSVQVIIVLVTLTLILLHIHCLPADCEDPFFTVRTTKQFHLDYQYIHKAQNVCVMTQGGGDVNKGPDAVILVLTMSKNVAERTAIRDTYGSVARGKAWPGTARQEEHSDPHNRRTGTARVVFLMGQTKDVLHKATEKETLAVESREYGDVVQWEGLLEDYSNLTLKVLLGLRWVRDMCPHAHHVVKTDDDIFLHVPRILTHLQGSSKHSGYIHGMFASCHATGRSGKYSSPVEVYPLPSRPVHVKGAMYAMGTDLALHLVSVAPFVPLDNMEDVFVTGVLACVVGAEHVGLSSQQYDGCRPVSEACDFGDGQRMAGKTTTTKIFYDIWRTFSEPDLCSESYHFYTRIATYLRPSICVLR